MSSSLLEINELKINELKTFALEGDTKALIPYLKDVINIPFFVSLTCEPYKKVIEERLRSKLESELEKISYKLDLIDMAFNLETIDGKTMRIDILSNELELANNLNESPFFFYIMLTDKSRKYLPLRIQENIMNELEREFKPNLEDFENEFKKFYTLDENWLDTNWYILNMKMKEEKAPSESLSSTSIYPLSIKQSFSSIKPKKPDTSRTGLIDDILNKLNSFKEFKCETEIQLEEFKKIFNILKFETELIESQLISFYFFKKKIPDDGFIEQLNQEPLKIRSITNLDCKSFLTHTNNFIRGSMDIIKNYKNEQKKFISALKSSKVNYFELLHQIKYAQQKGELFKDESRTDLLNKVKNRLAIFGTHSITNRELDSLKVVSSTSSMMRTLNKREDKLQQYLIIEGKSGFGKTCMISRFCKDINETKTKPILLMRFIGTSEDSSNIQTLLKSIIFQLEELLHTKNEEISVDEKELTPMNNLYKYFSKFLTKIGLAFEEYNFMIVLDSLDQLSDYHNARSLEWLPLDLPKNIKIIMSTIEPESNEYIPDKENPFLPHKVLHDIFTKEFFIKIEPFKEKELSNIFKFEFEKANRRLQSHQENFIFEKFKEPKSPLYLKIVIDLALKWNSGFDPETSEAISNGVDSNIEKIFDDVEEKYGKEFMSCILKFITLNEFGLDIHNLIDILKDDTELIKRVEDQFKRHLKGDQLSPLYIMQPLYALRSYLSRPHYNWNHRKVKRIAKERFSHSISHKEIIIDCYGKIKHILDSKMLNNDAYSTRVLPYLVLKASPDNCLNELLDSYLLNIDFMIKKIENCYIDELIIDFENTFEWMNKIERQISFKGNTIDIIYYALINAASSIRTSSYQLPGYLFGYLWDYNEDLNHILNQCKELISPVILPNKRFLCDKINNRPEIKILGMKKIKSVVRNGVHIYVSTDSFNVRYICNNFFTTKDYTAIKRESKHTKKLMISLDEKKIISWSCNNPNNNEVVLESINILDQKKSSYRHKAVNSIRLLNAMTKDNQPCLWLVSNDTWLSIIIIENEPDMLVHENKIVPWLNENLVEERICCTNNLNILYFAFNNTSKIYVVNSKKEEEEVQIRLVNDDQVTGDKFLFLDRLNMLVVAAKLFRKSPYGKTDEVEYYLRFCNAQTLQDISDKALTVGYELNLYDKSSDEKLIFASSYDLLLVIEIQEQNLVLYKLEHGSPVNDFFMSTGENEEMEIITVCDNRLNVWSQFNEIQKMNLVKMLIIFHKTFCTFMIHLKCLHPLY